LKGRAAQGTGSSQRLSFVPIAFADKKATDLFRRREMTLPYTIFGQTTSGFSIQFESTSGNPSFSEKLTCDAKNCIDQSFPTFSTESAQCGRATYTLTWE